MRGGEVARLAQLERMLVAAASRQVQRRRFRRRRLVVMLAVAAPLVLAVAGSVASTQRFFGGVDQQLSALRDDRLVSPSAPRARLFDALGALPRDQRSSRSWLVAGRRVTGYTTRGGSFCFRFGPFTGGCINPGELSSASPVAVTLDDGPTTFRVYGLAFDGVTGIELRAGGVTRPVLLSRNAVYLENDSLGGIRGFSGTLVVHLRGGGVTRLPLHSAGGLRPSKKFLPVFPASCRQGTRRPECCRPRPGPAFWGRRAGRLVLPVRFAIVAVGAPCAGVAQW